MILIDLEARLFVIQGVVAALRFEANLTDTPTILL